MIKRFGLFLAAAVLLIGGLAWHKAPSYADAVGALRGLATLLTVTAGTLSAVWWHQSASLSDMPLAIEERDRQHQFDAKVLNGAAATVTGLGVIGGAFSGLPLPSPEGALAAFAFIILLALSGDEIYMALVLSWRQGLRGRAGLVFLVLVIATVMFVMRRLLT